MAVTFTQYLMPDGQKRMVRIDLDEDTEKKAEQITEAGLFFECEVLPGFRSVSFTIADRKRGEDVAIAICPNGPKVPEVVTALINDFNLERWVQKFGAGDDDSKIPT